MSILFRFQPTDAPYERVNPSAKLAALLGVSAFVCMLQSEWQYLALLCVILLQLRFACRLQVLRLGTLLGVFAVSSLLLFIVQVLSIDEGRVLFQWRVLQITSGGLSVGITVVLRLAILVLSTRAFVETTEPMSLGISMHQNLRIPYVFALMMFLSLRFLNKFEQSAIEVSQALRVRGVSQKGRIRRSIFLLKLVLFRGLHESRILAASLDSRAYGALPNRTFHRICEMRGLDKALISLSLLGPVAYYLVSRTL